MTRFRLVLSLLGLAAALAGVLRDDRRLVWVAIAALAASVGLRIWARRQARR